MHLLTQPLVIFSLVICIFLGANTQAADEPASITQRIEHYAVVIRINDDFTHVEERDMQQRAITESSLDSVKNAKISYSSSVQRVEIIDAYTLKADGRKIPVPPGNFQEKANTGHRGAGPVFSDRASIGLVFPDITVGDAVRLHYRIIQTEPIFPGHFDDGQEFLRSYPYDDVKIVIDAPASLKANFSVREMQHTLEERDGRRVLSMSWKNPQPLREKRRDWSAYDPDVYPGYAYSTFQTHEAIAKAYGARALPKAAVTPAVRKLAAEISKGKKSKQEKARVLYEWVARNITYAGNCVGIGAVVPHDIDFILGNRMGDCKDHATLLQALLTAEGIANTQALVNASSNYNLPKIPQVSSVNHVINYIPEFDLFLDSTSTDTPFGYLPDQVAGKPVLLAEGHRENLRTPVTRYAQNRQTMTSQIEYLKNGTARGNVNVEQTGSFAIQSRAQARDMTAEEQDEHMRRMFDADGHPGFGKLTGDVPAPLLDTYRYTVEFERPLALDLPGAGGISLYPSYYSSGDIYALVDASQTVEEQHAVACTGGISSETQVVRLPAGTTVFALPDDVHIAVGDLRYDATYQRDGLTITAKRVLEDRTEGPLCNTQQQRDFQELSRKVQRDLRSQIVYQLKESTE